MNVVELEKILKTYNLDKSSRKGEKDWDSFCHLSLCTDICQASGHELTVDFINNIESANDLFQLFGLNEG